MGKRGPKPMGKVKIEWSADFAYTLGLLVTDGSVSKDGRHITLVSKDEEQLNNFMKALHIEVPISHSRSGYTEKEVTRIQFSDVLFSNFLQEVGIHSNKTKTIGKIDLPAEFFFDFLRGHLDGDGCVFSYWDKRWKSSFMFYTTFVSASREHIDWLRYEIGKQLKVQGHVVTAKEGTVFQLRFAKQDSLKLWDKMYYPKALCLTRKRLKIKRILAILTRQDNPCIAQVQKLVDWHA